MCNLHTALTNIKSHYFINKENKIKFNLSFTIPHKSNIKNLIIQVYNYNTTNNLLSTNHNLSSISTSLTEDQISINKNEETSSKDNINNHDENQVQYNKYHSSTLTPEEEEVSYKTAYKLLLDLLNNKPDLLEEALSIANILVKEGVLIAPESKIKKNIASIIPYTQKQKTQNLDHAR
ncbi:hypothetical protein K6025_02390 [Ehrlichia sp. JZT12]